MYFKCHCFQVVNCNVYLLGTYYAFIKFVKKLVPGPLFYPSVHRLACAYKDTGMSQYQKCVDQEVANGNCSDSGNSAF